MNIQQTTDYGIFKSIVSNREVDEKHVKRLMRAISEKNLLHLNPLVCKSTMEVVDGQHRLEAATRLGIPVFYMMDDQVDKSDIAMINSNAKNWNTLDYINYWTINKRPGFDKLSAFLSENPLIPAGTAMMMLSSDGKRDINRLREGSIDVENHQEACEIAEVIKYYRNIIDFAYERNFIMAVITMLRATGYDHEVMKKKLEYQSRSLVRCISRKQYTELLLEIYNYNSSKNRLSIK